MSNLELAQAIGQLTPENLLTVLTALLLCQKAANHSDHGFPIDSGKLINLSSEVLDVSINADNSIRDTLSGENPYISLRKAG